MLFINGQQAEVPNEHWLDFHGNSVFTTLKSVRGRPMLWERHWERLREHAAFFGYFLPKEYAIIDLIASFEDIKKIRIILYKNKWALLAESYATDLSLRHGVTAILSPYQVHKTLAIFKTGNSLPYALAHAHAQKLGYYEGFLTDQYDHVVDGSRTSIMLLKDETIISCSGGLMGVMREAVLTYAQQQGIKIERAFVTKEQFVGQILLANALIGLVPVKPIISDFAHLLVENFSVSLGDG